MSIMNWHTGKDLNVFFIRDTDTGAELACRRAASRR